MEIARYKLKDIVTLLNGKAYLMPELQDSGKYRILRVGNLSGGNDSWYYSDMELDEDKYCSSGDLLYAWACNFGPHIWKEEKVIYHYHVWKLIEDKQKVDKKYLYYYLLHQTPYYLGGVNGATMVHITKQSMEKKTVLIPKSIVAQRRIASILSAYDNLIENNNKRIRLLEQMAENLYKEWFVRFRFPGHDKAEFENGLPKGWKREKIGKVYNTCSGGTPSRVNEDFYNNGSIPWVKTGELQDCLIHDAEEFITEDALKRSSAKLLPNHSLLMAMYGVNIGKLGILRKEMTCNQAVCAFLPKTADQTFYYLYFYLKGIRNYLLSISFGAAQQNLSQALIKNVRIMIPHNDTLQKFENKVSCYFDQISIYQLQNEQLARQRDLLLPRLMSGKLEVNI